MHTCITSTCSLSLLSFSAEIIGAWIILWPLKQKQKTVINSWKNECSHTSQCFGCPHAWNIFVHISVSYLFFVLGQTILSIEYWATNHPLATQGNKTTTMRERQQRQWQRRKRQQRQWQRRQQQWKHRQWRQRNEDNDNEDNKNKDNDNDDYRGPNCDVRAVSQFCDVFLLVNMCFISYIIIIRGQMDPSIFLQIVQTAALTLFRDNNACQCHHHDYQHHQHHQHHHHQCTIIITIIIIITVL